MQHRVAEIELAALIADVANGKLALPQFQREFLWTPENVVELLESLANGWPIGSLLLLEGPQAFGLKRIDGGPPPDPELVRMLVLDGQQRVTSIFHALNDGSDDIIYFVDLDPARPAELPVFEWVRRSRGIPVNRQVTCHPISALFDPFYRRDIADSLLRAGIGDVDALIDQKLGSLSADLRLPAIVLNQDIELEALTRIFETLNRTGMRLDAFDLMVAILYPLPQRFHLGDEWKAVVAEHPIYERMDTKGIELLKLIALWQIEVDQKARPSSPRKVVGVRQRDVLNTPREIVIEKWPDAEESYRSALEMATNFGARNSSYVPSEAMLLTLADAISRERPTRIIHSWWWSAIATQSYAQGANTQVVADSRARLEEQPDLEVVLSSLEAGLLDQSRRNRILRLGLRCRASLVAAHDPLTNQPLGENVEEIAITDLLPGQAVPKSRGLTIDGLIVSRSSVKPIKDLAEAGRLMELHGDALEEQAFPRNWREVPLEEVRAHRKVELAAWFSREAQAIGVAR